MRQISVLVINGTNGSQMERTSPLTTDDGRPTKRTEPDQKGDKKAERHHMKRGLRQLKKEAQEAIRNGTVTVEKLKQFER